MNNSSFFSLNWKDLGKGFVVAALTAVTTALYQWFSATPPHFPTIDELKTTGLIALAAGISYLVKNLFTNSGGQVAKTEK